MDKFKTMGVFVAIVEAGSLTGAAERLETSVTVVVRSLAALESHLGVRLIQRTTRRMALTDEGRDYFERCRRILADVDEAESLMCDRQPRPSGRLTLTAPAMFGRLHVLPVVTEFLLAFPEMRVQLLLLDRVIDLVEEGMDLAVRIGSLPDSSLVALPLGQTQRVICASPAYLARCCLPQEPAELANHRLIRILREGETAEWSFERGREQAKVAVQEVLACNHIHAALDACRQGLGIGRFLAYQVRAAEQNGELQRLLPEWQTPQIPIQMVLPHGRLLSPRVRCFLDWAMPKLKARIAS